MIPRYQRILFLVLASAIILMAAFTIHEQQKAHDRFATANEGPYIAPVNASSEPVTLDLANDFDGSIASANRETSLPKEPSLRARALIERLFAEYALPESAHPLKTGAVADDVFLLKPPDTAGAESSHGLLAVVNLRSTFADSHPSGIVVETLTIQSIVGTLHANLPQITEIRFLVGGQPRETLAGHADLTRTYAAIDTAVRPLAPREAPQP